MATPLSIDAYKRKQNVLAAKAQKRRAHTSMSKLNPRPKETYNAEQRRYLNACVEKHTDPDVRLLTALREARFVLKLDRFGEEELAFHMKFLQKTKSCTHISLSLGSITVNRDLRTKFDRLGLKRAYAYENQAALLVTRSACSSAYKTSTLLRFHLIGVHVLPEVVPLLSKAFFHCHQLEDVNLNGTNLGDEGLEAIAMALGKCPKLHLLSMAGCNLTDKGRDHIAKIITLHGVIKDEAVWSSSLRGEATPTSPMPGLLINIARNKLGDETAEAICDALYNDKWVLGLNLGGNNVSQQGTEIFIDTLVRNNRTLAVLALTNMREPVATSTLDTLNSLLRVRNRFLQQVAMESREKRMALGSLLLDWGVNKDTVVEICYLESPNETVHTKGTHISSLASKKVALVSPRRQSGLIHSRLRSNTNQESHENSNNNDEDEKEDAASDEDEIVDSMTDSHVKTIEYLIERLSALEADKRKTEAYVSKLETENRELRKELESQAKEPPTLGISSIEAQIIAQLETSITSLAEQVEHMEHEKQHQPFTSASSTSLSS